MVIEDEERNEMIMLPTSNDYKKKEMNIFKKIFNRTSRITPK